MPRPRRYTFAGECYHVLNRANRKAEVFHDSADCELKRTAADDDQRGSATSIEVRHNLPGNGV